MTVLSCWELWEFSTRQGKVAVGTLAGWDIRLGRRVDPFNRFQKYCSTGVTTGMRDGVRQRRKLEVRYRK